MPHPVRVSPLRSGFGEGRGCHPARSAAALTTAMARCLQIAQAESDRVGADRGGNLVDEGFDGELDLRADRVAQVRGARRRGAVEQRWGVSQASRLLAKPSDSEGTPKPCNDFSGSPISWPARLSAGSLSLVS